MKRKIPFLTISFLLIFQSFAWNSKAELPSSQQHLSDNNSSFVSYSQELYNKINETTLDFKVFQNALKGYLRLEKNQQLKKTKYLSIIDMSLSSNQKRLFIINIETQQVEHKSLVAHGRASGGEFASKFSNIKNSHQTSLGFYKTAETYQGKHGFSLRLDGLEKSNNKARERAIVIHSAAYADQDFIEKHGRLGRSYGCPSLPKKDYTIIIDKIKNGSCLFISYPSKAYLKQSDLLHSEPVDLKA